MVSQTNRFLSLTFQGLMLMTVGPEAFGSDGTCVEMICCFL